MNRCFKIAIILCAFARTAHANEPKPDEEPKPPWQRLLTGDDGRKAAELDRRIAELQAADNYAEAIRLSEELLALRTKVQGADHWETVTEQWSLTARNKLAALPAEKRAGWRQAEQGAREGALLWQQAQYPKALALLQERAKWCREILGEDHPDTATSYNNVAMTLHVLGKYAEAALLSQKTLDICRKTLGEDHPDTATAYGNVARNLHEQGKYAEAGVLLQKALAIDRRVLGEHDHSTAIGYGNVGMNLNSQGKYAEAGPLLQKALAIDRQTLGEGHPATAASYASVAANLDAQGKYAEATPLLQKALAIRRQTLGEGHPDTAQSYVSLAYNLQMQMQYAEAGPLYQKAFDIYRKVVGEDHPDMAASYNNVAFNLFRQGKYAEAGLLFQKALAIKRKFRGEDHPDTARSYGNAAMNLQAQGKFAEAGPLYQKALDIRRQALGENHPDLVVGYRDVTYNLYAQGQYPQALASLDSAARSYEAARLSVAAGGLDRAAFGTERSPYVFLAALRSRAGQAADAWEALEADLARGLLDELANRRGSSLSPDEQRQRDDLRARRTPLEAQILALVGQRQRSDLEAAELERLLGQRRQLEKALADLAVTVSRREMATLVQLQAALPANAAFVAWIDVADEFMGVGEHWGCVVRPQGDPHWERLPGSGPGGQWTKADSDLARQFHTALAQSAPAADVAALAQQLHAQRLVPLTRHLAGVQRLFVAPVNWMAGVPVEALTDQYTVSYTPSGTYLAHLKDRQPLRSTGLLAIGDPVFPPSPGAPAPPALPPGGLLLAQVLPGGAAANAHLQPGDVLVAYAGEDLTSVEQLAKLIAARAKDKTVLVKVWREGQEKVTERELASSGLGVLVAKEPARQVIAARREADQLLARLQRGEQYAELPGTQVEIARLAELFDPKAVTALTRADASEQRLDELRRAGALKQFRYLHFATHGKANQLRAFDSALLLTPPAKPPEVREGEPYLDGRLTAAEVLEFWRMDADLVTLSACESGLGKRGGGEGMLGFAQSFLLAGSRSVCLSLWQVDDTATALLMDRFYRNLLGKRADGAKPMTKAAALREAKEWLRTVTASEALERLGVLTQGVVRGERPAREEMQAVPLPKDASKDYRPYAHPRYWAAFILIGDPE